MGGRSIARGPTAPETAQASRVESGSSVVAGSQAGSQTASGSHLISAPSINLPKGGGAIRGMGEKSAPNPVTGAGSVSVPHRDESRTLQVRAATGAELQLRRRATGHSARTCFGRAPSMPPRPTGATRSTGLRLRRPSRHSKLTADRQAPMLTIPGGIPSGQSFFSENLQQVKTRGEQ